MDISNIIFNAQNPEVKDSDILYDEEFTAMGNLPAKYLIQYQYISNQGSTPDCTAHGQGGASNENNGIEASKLNSLPDARLIDPVALGEFGHSIGKINANGGFINWAFPYLIEWGYITGYSVVSRTVSAMKLAILRNGALVTGSNSIPWGDFDSGWYAKHKPNSPGHCFRIDGWDDEKGAFRVANSWGEAWGDKGNFWIRYGDIDKLLYTCYAFHDKNDTSTILRAKAKKLKVWDGSRPDDIATRAETIKMAYRIQGKLYSDYNILADAKLKKVYDGTRDNENVTLFEAKIIFSRVGVIKSPNGISRGSLAECVN